jgi:WD40 repeat protein
LATGSSDGTIRLWDVATQAQIGSPMIAPGGAYSVAFSRDGQMLAVAGHTRMVMLMNIAFPANLARAMCPIARPVTPRVWSKYIPSEPYREICG